MFNRMIMSPLCAAAILLGTNSANSAEIVPATTRPSSLAAQVEQPIASFQTISCEQAKDILHTGGYRNIYSKDCVGSQYRFHGNKNGVIYVIIFDAVGGGSVDLPL